MPWSAPTYTGGVVWQDLPSHLTPLNAGNLNTEENAEATYAASVGQSVVNYFEGGNSGSVPAVSGPQDQDLIIRSGGTWARLAVGAPGQVLEIRSDNTLKYISAPRVSLSVWASTTATDAANAASIQTAITTVQNNGQTLEIDADYHLNSGLSYDMNKPLALSFTAGGRLTFTTDLALAAPTGLTATAQAGTTSFGGQTNYYRVTAFNANGEGLASAEVNVAITAGQQVALSWVNPVGATSVRVYRGTATGGENVYYALGGVTSYTDTNAATSGFAHPPLNGRTYYISATGTDQDGPTHYKIIRDPKIVGSGGILAATTGGNPPVRPSNTHGIQLAPKMGLDGRGLITGCNAAIDFYGDHQNITGGIACRGNYIGALWGPDPQGGQIGDHLISGADFSNNAFAAISISPASNQLYKDVFLRCHLGFNPIPIHIEAQGSAADAITRTDFIGCHMENFANALLWSASSNNNLTGVRFINCTGYWDINPAHQVSGLQAGWNIYNVGNFMDCEIDNCDALSNVGSVGVIAAQYVYRLDWREAQAVLDNLTGTTKPILQALVSEGFTLYGRGGAKYVVATVDTSTLVGDLMQIKPSPNSLSGTGPYFTRYVAAAVGSQAPIVGVAAQASPAGAFQNFVAVCVGGRFSDGVRNVAATTQGQYLVPDPANNGAVVSQAAAPGAGVQLAGIALTTVGASGRTDLLVDPKA